MFDVFDSLVFLSSFPSDLQISFAIAMKGATPLRQLSMFLNQTGPVWLAARSLIDGMREEKINYAVIGGLAVYAHGSQRTTSDIDILLARSVRKLGQFRKVVFQLVWTFSFS